MQGLYAVIESLPHLEAKELVQDRAVESLHKPVGLGPANPSATVLDAVQFQVQLVSMPFASTEFASVVGEDGLHRQLKLPIER